MDEQRTWKIKRLRRKRHLCILAAMLSVCVLFATYPDIPATLSVFASEEQAQAEGRYISGFTALSDEIREQTVPVGTEFTELSLPDTLEAIVTKQPSEDTAEENTTEQPEEEGKEDAGENDGKVPDGDMADTEKEENTEESAPAEEQQESAASQETHTVTMQEYHAENVISIQTLENTSNEEQEETVTIDGVTWQSDPEYDGNAEGIYIFTAVLPEGYTLAEDVSLPQITVTVKESESGTDFAIQALLERIAALPGGEEYFAAEPDMDDGDIYAEWEEKLYEYAEEALAIWEKYEELTEEQQAQMPEEELAKLVAWVEIAEQLSDRPTMLADNSEHHGESDWTALTASDTTLSGGKYYLSSDITMDTITVTGNVTLCLNGHTLTHDNSTDGSVIVVESGEFTLCDCQDHWGYTSSFDEGSKTYSCSITGTGGCITGGNGNNFRGGGVYVGTNAVFNMNSGRITGCDVGTEPNRYGGGVAVINGTFNMSGGYIDGNKANCGGGVYIEENEENARARFNMSGNAVIMSNEGNICGGVYCRNQGKSTSVTFNMDSGAVIGNKSSGNGAGVFLYASSTFNMCGGIIEGNCTTSTGAASSAGIYCMASTISLSGDCLIRYNTANAGSGGIRVLTTSTISISGNVCITDNYGNGDGTECNVSLANLPITVTKELTNDIGVTFRPLSGVVGYPKLVVTGTDSYSISDTDWSHFSSDNKTYEIQKKETTDTGNELWLAEPGKCNLFNLTASGATLSPEFKASETEYTSTVANNIDQVGITATLADTASGAKITIKINDGTETDMTSGQEEPVDLKVGENTIVITVTSDGMSKTYTIEITREAAKGNPVTITAYKDGEEWEDTPPTYKLKLTSGSGASFIENLTAVPDGTYYVYDGDINTNVTVDVNGTAATAEVYYHTVTFYDGDTALTTPAQQIVLKNQTAYAPATDPTKTGYTFDKWVTADGGSTAYDFTKAVTGKTSVYASWTPVSYSITYILDGGTAAGNPTSYTIESGAITLKNPTKTGYSFTGWGGTDLTGNNNTSVTIAAGSTGDRTYTAYWKAADYAVTLHTNGGDSGTDLTSYTYGTGAALPTDWKKTGYTFDGWYDNERFTGTAVTDISGTDTGDKEYWAKWTANTYQATFDYHGADGGNTIQSKTVTYDSTYGALPVPTRTGYTFKGWYTGESGQGSKVEETTVVKTASAHTLYAYWKDETPPDKPVLNGMTLPADWTNTQDKIPLKLYDGVGVTELWVSIDENDSYTKVNGFSGGIESMTYDYTPVLAGEHTYQFKAVDAAGNFAESDIFTVNLDKTKPEIGDITYENKAKDFLDWIIGKKSLIIHVPVTDTGSGVTEISYTMTPRDAAGNLDESKAVEKKAAVKDGEAKITFDKDFRGTIAIGCKDAAGNAADSKTIGTESAGGVIVEDTPPDITTDARTDYYDTPTAIQVTVKDDTENAITAGIATVKYKVGDGTEHSVTASSSALQEEVIFTIPAPEISTGITEIKVTATDNAGNEATERFTVKVKGPEKQPAAKIDYRDEKLTNLVPGGNYTIDGTEYTADGEGRIPIKGSWPDSSISITKKGNGSETTDSTAQNLSIPARPAAPGAPELSTRDDKSITLKTITGAQYRRTDGTDNWQDRTAFTGLAQKTIYRFRAYYPATDTRFASLESDEAQIATMPTAPTPDKLRIGYAAETLAFTDGIKAFTDQSCTTRVTAGSVEDYMGRTVYIRYPANGIIPASLTTAVSIPARPARPIPGATDASYPTATDGAITGLTSGTTYEYRVKDANGNFGAWKDATPGGTKIENLPAGDYEVRVKAVETGNVSFQSEAADIAIGAKPATKYEMPDVRIDYLAETLTGFVPGAKYTIGGDTIAAGADGTLPIKKEWFGKTLSIMRNGNGKDKLDSDAQSLPVPARPVKPTPTGVDVSTAGGTGKLADLTAGTAYEVSTGGGRPWVSHTADGSGQITGLAPGTYVVRVKAGTSSFVSEPSESVEIGAYQIKVAFMVDGAKYKEISVDYGTVLTDIPPVPAKENAIGAWCMDKQGTTPAEFTNITADMTVYAVYTTTYTVTLQGGTGYTLSAQPGSESPVRKGGSFTFRFALANGYQKTADFAVKVNGVKAELTAQEPYTYTISDIRENKTVTVEGVAKKPGGKPSDGGDKGDGQKPENPTPNPPVTPPAKPTPPAPGETPPAEKQPEGRPGTTPKQEENAGQEERREPEEGPGAETGTPKPDGAGSGQPTEGTPTQQVEVKLGNGTVIVTVVCEEERCTATVADTEKVVKAVLTPGQQELVKGGETIEIRIDVADISEKVPVQDKEVIESGIEAYRKEVPGLVLGMYVDISMFIKIGAGGWDAVTETDEPIEVLVNIPEKLQSIGREFYIIRAHDGVFAFMNDMDDDPSTITVSTDRFSSYAIAYVQAEGTGHKCGLCHVCPTFLGICYFVWLAIVILIMIVVIILLRKKKEEQEAQDTGQ